ncbi:hypothetical protein CF139_16630 [Aeromonas hydrophila]|nr:hypothetical protein CF139_16630 [Aeromonas hydrophila]
MIKGDRSIRAKRDGPRGLLGQKIPLLLQFASRFARLGRVLWQVARIGAEEGGNHAIFSGLGFAWVDKTDRLFAAECLAAMAQ